MTGIATPPSLFVVACPACGGRSAATVAQVGAAACCPLCAAAFLVPHPAAAPNQAPPVHASPPADVPAVSTPAATQPAPIEQTPPTSAAAAPQPNFESPEPVQATPAPAAEMQFRDPVKMVGRGPNAIELRRLTPEEKDARRRRRNIVMLLTGAAILIAIAAVLGSGGRRR
jgi:hypothetical protein